MANLKEIRNRIASVAANEKITQAMKLVSAAKFKKASQTILAMSPYTKKVYELLYRVSCGEETFESPLLQKREVKKVLFIVFTSNRGLCGAFNSNIVKLTKKLAATQYKGKEIVVVTVGTKGADALKKIMDCRADISPMLEKPSYNDASEIAFRIIERYEGGSIDEVLLIYNSLKNATTQIPTAETFLPIDIQKHSCELKKTDYIFEPNKQEILKNLLPQSLKLIFYKTLADSVAAEHGARMTAMHKATDNANELKAALTLKYNKERQSAITSQLTEIVSGSEALAG